MCNCRTRLVGDRSREQRGIEHRWRFRIRRLEEMGKLLGIGEVDSGVLRIILESLLKLPEELHCLEVVPIPVGHWIVIDRHPEFWRADHCKSASESPAQGCSRPAQVSVLQRRETQDSPSGQIRWWIHRLWVVCLAIADSLLNRRDSHLESLRHHALAPGVYGDLLRDREERQFANSLAAHHRPPTCCLFTNITAPVITDSEKFVIDLIQNHADAVVTDRDRVFRNCDLHLRGIGVPRVGYGL